MEEQTITLQGMRDGVRDSECFLLVLTAGVLFRPYCIEEIHMALVLHKPVIIVAEQDPRLAAFVYHEWCSKWKPADSDYSECVSRLASMERGRGEAAAEQMMVDVARMLKDHLDDIIPFRRRNFESNAMLAEILRRNDLFTSADMLAHSRSTRLNVQSITLLHSTTNVAATEVATRYRGLFSQRGVAVVDNPSSLTGAVLLVLTDGTLCDDVVVDALSKALHSRSCCLEVIQSKWTFNSLEQRSVSERDALIGHMFVQRELVTDRPPTSKGSTRNEYEQLAVVDELLRLFEQGLGQLSGTHSHRC